MATHPLVNPDVTPAAATPGRRRFVRYYLWGLILPFIAYVLAFPLVRTRGYENWGETMWGPMLEYAYEPNIPNADVVIFGDSSAFLGIDPRIVDAQLGIKTLVLPSTVGSLPVIGDAPLQNYLEHHRPPRLIVLYFSPWNLDFQHIAPGRMFEGEEMMVRHGDTHELLDFAKQHPLELPAFPFRLYSTFGPKMLLAMLRHDNRAAQTAEALGHADYREPYPPLTDLCQLPNTYLSHKGMQTAQELARKYSTPQTSVMVYLAPIPNCKNSRALQTRNYTAVNAAPPVILPPTDFAADPYYAHIQPPHVPTATQALINALKKRLNHQPPTP